MSIDTDARPVPPPPPPPGAPLPPVTPARVLAGVSLAVPIVALLWVNSYARLTPKLGGMPFFYWYQILWIPVSALFTGAAYLLLNHDAKQRKSRKTAKSANWGVN